MLVLSKMESAIINMVVYLFLPRMHSQKGPEGVPPILNEHAVTSINHRVHIESWLCIWGRCARVASAYE